MRLHPLLRLIAAVSMALLLATAGTALSAAKVDAQPTLVLDGDTFIMFYDLPSRRFRAMRRAFIERDDARFEQDKAVSMEYLAVEMRRMDARLGKAMQEVLDGLSVLSLQSGSAVTELDALFGRSHWLLAQHFLQIAQMRVLGSENTPPSIYLIATAHHLERAALWSGAETTPGLIHTLDELRATAAGLNKKPNKARYQRLIARTANVLKDLSGTINRPIRVELG